MKREDATMAVLQWCLSSAAIFQGNCWQWKVDMKWASEGEHSMEKQQHEDWREKKKSTLERFDPAAENKEAYVITL